MIASIYAIGFSQRRRVESSEIAINFPLCQTREIVPGWQPDLERERVINEEEEEAGRIGAVTVIYSRRINIYA